MAAALAAVTAWLAPEPVPEWVFEHPPMVLQRDDREGLSSSEHEEAVFSRAAALARSPTLDGAVEALHRYGLITRVREGLRMHPLIQTAIRENTPQAEQSAWIESALGFLLRPMKDASAGDQEALVPHVAACAEAAESADVDPLALCWALAWLGNRHYYLGTLGNARYYQEKARALATSASLPHEVIFNCLADLVRTYRAEGDIEAALTAIADWRARAEETGDELARYRARRAHAHTLVYARRLQEAAEAFAALSASEIEDPDLSEQIMDLSATAELECGRTRYEEALALIEAALELAHQVESEERRNDHYAALHGQAAGIFHELGRLPDALARQRQSVEAARACGLGVLLTVPLYGLASRLLDLDIEDEAEQIIAEGMQLAGARGTKSPEYGKFLQASGRLALLRKDWARAERLLTEAAQLAGTGGEPNRADLAAACYNLGVAYTGQSNHAAAINSFQQARDIDAAVYGNAHPELLMDEYSLAAALYADGRLEAARAVINRCLAILRKGHQVGRQYRTQVITLAIAIDTGLGRTAP